MKSIIYNELDIKKISLLQNSYLTLPTRKLVPREIIKKNKHIIVKSMGSNLRSMFYFELINVFLYIGYRAYSYTELICRLPVLYVCIYFLSIDLPVLPIYPDNIRIYYLNVI